MGKKAAPKLAIAAKNHIENQVTCSPSDGPFMALSKISVNPTRWLGYEQTDTPYKPFCQELSCQIFSTLRRQKPIANFISSVFQHVIKMQTDGKLLSVVVPMRNEEQTVGDVISRLKKVLHAANFRYEVIVVDDCSKDNSVNVALLQGARVIELKEHRGKGYALRAGFAKAKGDFIATIDSDGSHLPEELPGLLLPIIQNQADMSIGCRFNGKPTTATRRLNQAGNRLFNMLIRALIRESICDSQSGYRVMTAQVLHSLMLLSDEYQIESEMLVKTARKGFRIREVKITFEQRTYGRSGVDPIVDGAKILTSILWSYLRS